MRRTARTARVRKAAAERFAAAERARVEAHAAIAKGCANLVRGALINFDASGDRAQLVQDLHGIRHHAIEMRATNGLRDTLVTFIRPLAESLADADIERARAWADRTLRDDDT